MKFYDESIKLWQDLAQDFDLNLFYSTRGHYTLAHADASVRTMRWRAEVNKHFGIDSELVSPQEVQKACPYMDINCGGNAPVLGALYHAPGSIARHDAVAWGYGRGADLRGVEIHQKTEVLGIEVKGSKITGVRTSHGNISTPKVLCAVAGSTPRMLKMDKPFFIGQRSLQIVAKQEVKQKLVCFTLDADIVTPPQECHLVTERNDIAGRVTSIAFSPTRQRYIGLAYVTPELVTKGEFSIRLSDRTSIAATICPTPFYDPGNLRQKAAIQRQEVGR